MEKGGRPEMKGVERGRKGSGLRLTDHHGVLYYLISLVQFLILLKYIKMVTATIFSFSYTERSSMA